MRAIRQYAFGPPENLRYEDVPDPVPSAQQVRLAVEAAGVHLIDTAIRRGVAWGPLPPPNLPMIPGREVAGVVDAVGPNVDASWLGRRVVAHFGPASGGYAERAVAAASALHEIPHRVAADTAVAMIGTGRTAMTILDSAALKAGEVVLVTAAAGGLGSLLIQAARNAGAVAVGLAGGTVKAERAGALGATITVDYLQPDWPDRVRSALGHRTPTVLLDGVGGEIGRAALDLLGAGGRAVLFGGSSAGGAWTTIAPEERAARRLRVATLERPANPHELETRALATAAAGRLVPAVQRFALADAAAAHAALETRATMGKVVLIPEP